ncbi:methyl-accepting chemotaxis protein [Paenibacillus endophyticus]|uniref:Methyl-accepting chemotaxis protein n=1 Tax=Paenibacillus endophyticus TaxID=1294268 RepID=A0A7W5GAQ7_9BACL|nr:methyl-accepting chemotaxis protein [Paenibacillus endophyticus]MBB3153504.1 methyl-accepting chemotaxis protein [Paenibacillus endophyticus]
MNVLRKLSLTFKFITVVGLVIALVLGSILLLNLQQVRSLSINKGELEAEKAGMDYATKLENTMTEHEATLRTLSSLLLETRKTSRLSREDIIAIMSRMLQEQPGVFGLYTLWEPDAFDQNDQANRSKAAYDDASGRFVPYLIHDGEQVAAEPLKDYEKPGAGDYYLIPKASKKLSYIEPYTYEAGGVQTELMSVVYPILDDKGTFLGIVGIDLSLTQLQEEAAKYKPMEGYVSLVTEGGVYAANPNDPDSVLQPYGDNPEKQQLWEQVKSGKNYKAFTLNSKGISVLRVFDPVHMPGSEQVWYTQSAVSKEVILTEYEDAKISSIWTSIAAMLILAAVMAFLIWSMVIKPLRLLSGKLQLMSQGDLTQQLHIRTGDEFGIMGGHFNEMTGKLRGMFQLVSDLSMAVGATSEQLTASAEQTGKASETIAMSIGHVAEGAQSQHHYASEASQAMGEMTVGVQRIADSSASVSTSAEDVAKQTQEGSAQLQAAINLMDELQTSVAETGSAIDRLGERSDQIGGMIDIIAGISTQTNLLALNAAIEASRVGEHGRGFAVVAAEIRKLAEQTKKAAEQVTDLVEDVRGDTHKAALTMAAGNEKVQQGVKSVADSGQLFASILTEMTQVNGQIQEVSAAAQQMTASTEQISASVVQLADLASDASSESQSVAAASEEQLASMEEISASAEALSNMVQELLEKLSEFKI